MAEKKTQDDIRLRHGYYNQREAAEMVDISYFTLMKSVERKSLPAPRTRYCKSLRLYYTDADIVRLRNMIQDKK